MLDPCKIPGSFLIKKNLSLTRGLVKMLASNQLLGIVIDYQRQITNEVFKKGFEI